MTTPFIWFFVFEAAVSSPSGQCDGCYGDRDQDHAYDRVGDPGKTVEQRG
jgi:hypothetical protein